MSEPPEDVEATPFDSAWSTLSSFLVATGIAVFLLLTIGDAELFDGSRSPLTDGGVVGTAYFGALVLTGGLSALAGVGFASVVSVDGPRRPPWPRYRRIEDDRGRRSRALAIGALVFITSIPTLVVYVCLYKYVTKSRVALWNGTALPGEFGSSRMAALGHKCGEASACFRMHPSDGAPEWFFWSDPLLTVLVLATLGAWGALGVRMHQTAKNNP